MVFSLSSVVFGLLLVSVSSSAQSLSGTWQASIDGNLNDQVVLTIKNSPTGSPLSASIHHRGRSQVIPADSLTLRDGHVTLTVQIEGVLFKGLVDVSQTHISGNWNQSGKSKPAVFTRATESSRWDDDQPSEPKSKPMKANEYHISVATIKRSSVSGDSLYFGSSGRELHLSNLTPLDLLEYAFDLKSAHILELPKGIQSSRFDVVVLPDQDGLPTLAQCRTLIQELLRDRFGLLYTPSTRMFPIYSLQSTTSTNHLITADSSEKRSAFFIPQSNGETLVVEKNATMKELAGFLTREPAADREVLDQTGLTGGFDFSFHFQPGDNHHISSDAPANPEDKDDTSNLFQAIETQLGLALRPTKSQMPVLIINRLLSPTAN